MEEERISRAKKIALVTLLSATAGLIASVYLTGEEPEENDSGIFEGVRSEEELNDIWRKFNLINHPDKIKLSGPDFVEHMEKYHEVKERYEHIKKYSLYD